MEVVADDSIFRLLRPQDQSQALDRFDGVMESLSLNNYGVVGAGGHDTDGALSRLSTPCLRRVAACMTGFARTLGERSVYTGISTLLQVERASGSCVDLFAVVRHGSGDTLKGQRGKVPTNASAAAIEALTRASDYAHWEDPGDKAEFRHCGLPCTARFAKMARCAELMRLRERKETFRYDWAVHMRPDIQLNAPRAITSMGLRKGAVYQDAKYHDLLVYASRELLNATTERPSSFPCDKLPPTRARNHLDITCEALLLASIREAGVRILTHRIGAKMVRTPEARALIARTGVVKLHGKEYGKVRTS